MTDSTEMAEVRHQLRNHVNNITMNAELAKMQLESAATNDKVLVSVNRILKQCQNCAEFLNDLSKYS